MKYNIGDHVRIINKTRGIVSFESLKRSPFCPDLNNAVIRLVKGNYITIRDYGFNESDLEPSVKGFHFYRRLLTKVTNI